MKRLNKIPTLLMLFVFLLSACGTVEPEVIVQLARGDQLEAVCVHRVQIPPRREPEDSAKRPRDRSPPGVLGLIQVAHLHVQEVPAVPGQVRLPRPVARRPDREHLPRLRYGPHRMVVGRQLDDQALPGQVAYGHVQPRSVRPAHEPSAWSSIRSPPRRRWSSG